MILSTRNFALFWEHACRVDIVDANFSLSFGLKGIYGPLRFHSDGILTVIYSNLVSNENNNIQYRSAVNEMNHSKFDSVTNRFLHVIQ